METPVLSLKDFQDFFKDVYEPSEDSFLLLDAIEQDLNHLKSLNPLFVVEVGCGSGIISTAVRKSLGSGSFFLATDINPRAGDCCLECTRLNGVKDEVQVVLTDLTSALEDRLENQIDILMFNPPYVPTEDGQDQDNKISLSRSGGHQGMETTNRLLDRIPRLLSSTGVFYLVLLKENDIQSVMKKLKCCGLESRVILKRKCGREDLYVLSGNKSRLN